MIEVRLFATLRVGRQKICYFDPYENITAADLMTRLDIPSSEVAIILVNGFHSKPETEVKDGDIISFFPPVAGG